MSGVIKIKKGLDIRLTGKAEKILETAGLSTTYAVKPTDFHGLTPKLAVKVDHKVQAGSPLFFDKYNPEIKFTSPVSGTVVSINRGERRRILEVVVEADEKTSYEEFQKADPLALSRDEIKEQLLKSGLWTSIVQRPFGILADPSVSPKNIFISCFDTAPLAPEYDFVLNGAAKEFQTGINALAKLTDGKVILGLSSLGTNKVFADVKNAEVNYFEGPHPAGNVGIQIQQVDPINKGDLVWTVNPQDVVLIGRLFEKGIYDASIIVALTGSQVKAPRYFRAMKGMDVVPLLVGRIKDDVKYRVISGNVLTGKQIPVDGFLGMQDSQITVIPEGDEIEMFGWALPGFGKYSPSRTFFSWLTPKKNYVLNANYHGGERAFVMSEQYEKVLPMDILPVHLLKSILANDLDKMEQLGIYEVLEEDLALCEYICTSKIKVQDILRSGITSFLKEIS